MMALGYQPIEEIGEGGYGQVVRARLDDGRMVAVKRLSPERSLPLYRESLRKEAELAAKLSHPNIVAILGVNDEPAGDVALIMELVDGIDVARLLRVTRLPLAAAIHVGRALLSALMHAHEQANIVHRDISPHNVLISWDGEVKLTDFGIAKMSGQGPTSAGQHRGKLTYMSPEQFQGDTLDARSDLFAVGLIMYELLAGCLPYGDADEPLAFIIGDAAIMPLDERCPEIAPELSAIVMKLLERDKANRYPSAHDVLVALPDWPHGQRDLAFQVCQLRGAGAFGQRTTRAPEHRRQRLMLVAAFMLGTAFGTGATWLHVRLTAPTTTAPEKSRTDTPTRELQPQWEMDSPEYSP